ncbi:MAG: hypothetical protein KA314_14030, partial [Chloroflexi bacterium]|nr:hypothetical protein [Chloroflexota bacterium]
MSDDTRRAIYVIAGCATLLFTQSLFWAGLAVGGTWLVFRSLERGWWGQAGGWLGQGLRRVIQTLRQLVTTPPPPPPPPPFSKLPPPTTRPDDRFRPPFGKKK